MKSHSIHWKIFLAFLLSYFFTSCKKPTISYLQNGDLLFSADTIRFDTLFTTLTSPTKRLLVYNQTDENLLIDEISLLGGDNSEFKLIIDGLATQKQTNYELRKRDSFYIFIQLIPTRTQEGTIIDYLHVKTGVKEWFIPLIAYVLDAYFIRDSVLICNTTFPTDKPIVIDGPCIVDTNCTLTILPGTQIYFTPRQTSDHFFLSGIYVFGTLKVFGNPTQRVLFTSTRRDQDYLQSPGQWQGLYFATTSLQNEIHYAIIENGDIGIRVDSSAINSNPKLILTHSFIRNMANYGLLLLGFSDDPNPNRMDVVVSNSVIYQCGLSCIGIFGGGFHQLVNNTLINTTLYLRRQQPTLGIQNYHPETQNTYPLHLFCLNNIIWGNETNEMVWDLKPNPDIQIAFQYNLVKLEAKLQNEYALDSTNLFNEEPSFNENPFLISFVNDTSFALQENSICINKGANINGITPPDDYLGTARDNFPDLGAYEWK